MKISCLNPSQSRALSCSSERLSIHRSVYELLWMPLWHLRHAPTRTSETLLPGLLGEMDQKLQHTPFLRGGWALSNIP